MAFDQDLAKVVLFGGENAGAAFGTMVGWVVSNTIFSGHFWSERMRRVDLSTLAFAWAVLLAEAFGAKASNANSSAISAPPTNRK